MVAELLEGSSDCFEGVAELWMPLDCLQRQNEVKKSGRIFFGGHHHRLLPLPPRPPPETKVTKKSKALRSANNMCVTCVCSDRAEKRGAVVCFAFSFFLSREVQAFSRRVFLVSVRKTPTVALLFNAELAQQSSRAASKPYVL